MNRTELIDAVAGRTGLDKRQAEAAVVAFVDSVVSEARAGNKVSVFGFGVFSPTQRAARTGRNPRTGAPVRIAASKGVKFAPASAFKAALNTRGAAKKTAASAKAAGGTKAAAKKAAPAKAAAKRTAAPAKKAAKTTAKATKATKTTKATKKR